VSDELSLFLVPGRRTGGLNLGKVQVVATLDTEGALVGRWKSDIGTEGIFRAIRFEPKLTPDLPKKNSVFVVHGHDEGARRLLRASLSNSELLP
jgi:predicted nucleotide-binding protein